VDQKEQKLGEEKALSPAGMNPAVITASN